MGTPSATVYLDYRGITPHTFIKLDDGSGNVQFYGFAPKTPNSPSGVGTVGKGLTTRAIGDPDNSKAGYIDEVSWSKEITLTSGQYAAMKAKVDAWDANPPDYKLLGTNCTSFVVDVLDAGNARYAGIRSGPNPFNVVPVTEESGLFTIDLNGARVLSSAVRDPVNTPGTPAYDARQNPGKYGLAAPATSTPLSPSQDAVKIDEHQNSDGTWVRTTTYADNSSNITQTSNPNTGWSYAQTNYDASGRKDTQDIYLNDGSKRSTDYDQANGATWTYTEVTSDTQGRKDVETTVNDDNSWTYRDNDQTNGGSWNYIEVKADTLGRRDTEVTVNDDNSYTYRDNDQANSGGWNYVEVKADSQGRRDIETTVNDDNSWTYRDNDQANNGGWNYVEIKADTLGRRDVEVTVNDDNSYTYRDNDQANSGSWGYVEVRVDAQGRRDVETTGYDDGSRFVIDLDQTGMRGYQAETKFDSLNRVDAYRTIYSDGHSQLIDYDETGGSQSYSRIVHNYDTQDREDTSITYNWNGSRVEVDFDQDNSDPIWDKDTFVYNAYGQPDYAKYDRDDGRYVIRDINETQQGGVYLTDTLYTTSG